MQEERDTEPRRKTEQGDELTEEHSIAEEKGQSDDPYRPGRQPAQDQPEEQGEDEGKGR